MSKAYTETAEQITLHGLGFLQVKLAGGQRIHVWHPALPRRKCHQHSSIHDHRFGFVSTVLVGRQVNQFYRIDPLDDPTHTAYLHEGERTVYGNRPWTPHFNVALAPVGPRQVIEAGESYTVNPYILHATDCQDVCVTLIKKTVIGDQGAHSFCEIGVTPDVDFDRKQWPEKYLWKIFTEAMGYYQ